ncbi:MAG: GIY-YIG nuclease family protein, partial [Gemmataceae bacterium]
MNGLFRRENFTGFGPCTLTGGDRPLFGGRGRAGRLRALVRRAAPRAPGVYGMVDVNGNLIYVGKARSLRSRLMSYFVPSRPEKAASIVGEARRLVWEPAANEFAALLRELELIRRWRPRWNVAGQPRRQRRVYLCVGRKPAPHAFVAAKVPSTADACWGPFPGQRRTREACDRLNDWFRLRDCPEKQVMRFADQNELFPVAYTAGCLRHEIGRCL